MTEVQNTHDAMQAAFSLPAGVKDDPELSALHRQIIEQLRSESMGIPMHTVQELMLERIATEYVLIKWREQSEGWVGLGIGAEDKAKTHWKNLVSEWNKVLASGQETLRNALVQEVTKISMEALELIEDDESRKAVRLRLIERFAAIGL